MYDVDRAIPKMENSIAEGQKEEKGEEISRHTQGGSG